jgi:hypothetical protein
MRDVIFISHATPEDNDFAIWLSSRFELLGYKIWIDKKGLIGGEKFWESIDDVIRNQAVKFILIYSNNIFQKDDNGHIKEGKLKDGIYKEFSLAESISKKNNLLDFIQILNVDGSDYNLFIGADRLNQIPFYENWASGLKQLEKKLVKDETPKFPNFISNEFGSWYETDFIKQEKIIAKNEMYYSNWWRIPKLPDYFFIYQFLKKEQADIVARQKHEYPLSKISNHISSFEEYNTFSVEQNGQLLYLQPLNIFKIKVSDVLIGFESHQFPKQKDAENHLKQLLQKVFHQIMKNRGMFWYEMANRRLAYFYTTSNLISKKVKFEYPYRKPGKYKYKTKNLIGKHLITDFWHYAISVKPIFSPLVGYSLKNHIAFTSDGLNVWKNNRNEVDKDRIHRERRKKGKRIFNEEWRDLHLAFINGLKKEDRIEIALTSNFILEMPSYPEIYRADFGYFDPKDKSRHGLLTMYDFEEDNFEEND